MKKTQSIQWKMRQIAVAVAAALCVEGAYAIPGNTQLPTGFESVIGGATTQTSGNIMTVTQQVQTAVNRWENFSVGADAIVKFEGPNNQFNSVNFVNSGTISEIYGQISATNGNIFIANPAGVQIGASAQINVGSLYVSNKDITGLTFAENATTQNVIDQIQKQTAGAAELMSLGTIIVADPKVTFDGSRIVIDTDRLYAEKAGTETERAGTTPLSPENLIVRTNDTNNVVLGYTAYNAQNGTYNVTEKTFTVVDEQGDTQIKGYMWVEDLFQLQNISTNTGGWYALRNSIDANYTSEQNYGDGHGFAPIDDFIGRLDGLGNSIFSLTIKRSNTGNVGLFGTVKDGAVLRNFNMISGTILGSGNVGSVVGHVSVTSSKSGSVVIENIINTADVEGQTNVGGLVGKVEGAENATAQLSGLVNVGTISGTSSVGGIAGSAGHTIIQGETYNLGAVRGDRTNVGGLVGDANNITIGNEGESFQIYNQADVQGAYNVGGIVGSLTTSNGSTSKVVNVANHGTVTAQGATDDSYFYHTAELSIEDIADIADDLDSNGVANVTVATSNVGGIVGTAVNSSGDRDSLTLSNVLNDGNVLTAEKTAGKDTYYIGGNVGGVVGHAQNIAIDGATNRENTVAGAHNVWGGDSGDIAGFLHSKRR